MLAAILASKNQTVGGKEREGRTQKGTKVEEAAEEIVFKVHASEPSEGRYSVMKIITAEIGKWRDLQIRK